MWTLFIRVFNIYELIVDIQVQQKNNFNRHMQSMHKEEYDKAKLEKDPQVYDAINEKVYFACKSCHYKTAYNGDLKKHMQS